MDLNQPLQRYDEDGHIVPAFQESRTSRTHGDNDTHAQNPWTTALGVIGGGSVTIGAMIYAAGHSSATAEPDFFEEADPNAGLAAMFFGEMLVVGGVFFLGLWLVVLAQQWYRRHEDTS